MAKHRWSHNPVPHRRLNRLDRGRDVRRFMRGLNSRAKHVPEKLDRTKSAHGIFDDQAFGIWTRVRYWIGLPEWLPPTILAQAAVRWPWTRTPAARKRAKRRRRDAQGGYDVAHRPTERHQWSVRNQSARDAGTSISLIVLHDTEGGSLDSVHNLFNSSGREASAHVGVAQDGTSVRYVPDARKAWACVAFNSVSLNVEQLGFASQTDWPDAQLRKTAEYIAYWAKLYRISIRHSTSSGVCQHKDLGVAGGNHSDCGPHYPFDRVLEMARNL